MTKEQEQPVSRILPALHQVMSQVGYVQKKGKNKFHNYKYAGEGDLLEVLRPAMVEAGLLLIPSHREVSQIDQYGNITVTIEYTLAHKDGEVWPEKIVVFGCGNDKNSKGGVGDKGVYKAVTGANKYLLFKLFQIETGDDPETKEEAEDAPENNGAQSNTPQKSAPEEPPVRQMSKADARPEYETLVKEIQACQDVIALEQWGQKNKSRLKAMPEDWQQHLRNEYADHKHSLEQRTAA